MNRFYDGRFEKLTETDLATAHAIFGRILMAPECYELYRMRRAALAESLRLHVSESTWEYVEYCCRRFEGADDGLKRRISDLVDSMDNQIKAPS